jgi:parvulin-like peptidyl-prolyl isomerase
MKAGERSPIFRTPFGFHIAEVLARTPGGIPELREVKDTIRLVLIAAREEVAARHVAERLRAQAQIRRISTREAARLAAQQGTG